jgi:hypothetical protein
MKLHCSVLLSLLEVMIVVDRSRDIPHLIRFLKTCIKEGNSRNSPQVSVEEETGLGPSIASACCRATPAQIHGHMTSVKPLRTRRAM